jgi:hypothetical protein
MDVLAALIPPIVVVGFFIALLVTALRATDRASRGSEQPELPHSPSRTGQSADDPGRDVDGSTP